MSPFSSRHAILPALFVASLALPAAAQDPHHPPAAELPKPPATQPAQAQPPQPGGPGMMTGNMMQMMHRMMSEMMQNRGGMHRMRMMAMAAMDPMHGPMAGVVVKHVEGHIAFLKAELKIAAAQSTVWEDYATALRANARQLNELTAAMPNVPAASSPVQRLAGQEQALAARLEIARRTKPALAALYAALSDEQKKTFGEFAMPRVGMH